MKKIRTLLKLSGVLTVLILIIFFTFNVINDDLYGRLIETKSYNKEYYNDSLPTITLVLKEYVEEKNSIESSLIINYNQSITFRYYNEQKLEFEIFLTDRFNYNQIGLIKKFIATDSINSDNSGYLFSGFESDNFLLPVTPSTYGYPIDDLNLFPYITLDVNKRPSKFLLKVQKRISGRILDFTEGNDKMINLSRTLTEKILVYTSSIIFLILTFVITFSLIKRKKSLTSIEELIMVAGYILAIAGFREILGISREFGTSLLEVIVILIPLVAITIGLSYSYLKKEDNNDR